MAYLGMIQSSQKLVVPMQHVSQAFNILDVFLILKINKPIFHIMVTKCHHCQYTVKILKFGTPQTIAIIVLKIEKFDVTLH